MASKHRSTSATWNYLLLFCIVAVLFLFYYLALTFRRDSVSNFKPVQTDDDNDAIPVYGRKLRMLFFTHGFNYEYGMDRFFFTHYYGLRDHPWIEVTLWGIGIDGYNASISIRENLIQRYGTIYFDVLYIYGMVRNNEVKDLSGDLIVMIREHECWDKRCLPYFIHNGVKLAMLTYAWELLEYQEVHDALIVHSPHTVNPDIFRHNVNSRREIDVLLAGSTNPGVYPLRQRFSKLIQRENSRSWVIRSHPDYFAQEWKQEFWDSYQVNMSNVNKADAQVYDYAKDLKRAKICLMDSSLFKYALMKYTEAPMAGCLIVGDIPHERMDEFRQGVVAVSDDMSDEELISTIKYWLSHEEERLKKASLAQRNAMQYTVKKWGDLVIKSTNRLVNHGFGMVFDYQFELTCAAKSIIDKKLKNEYCRD